MSKVRIITERVTSLSYAFAKKQNIYLFPVNIIKGEEVFKDSNDEEGKKFIEEMESFEEIPSTAVPAPGEMKKILLEAVKETKKGIYISASSKLSGLHSLGVKVADELNKEGYNPQVPRAETHKIYDRLMAIYEIAEKNKISTNEAAIALAEYRIKYGIGRRVIPPYFHHTM